MTTWTCDPTGNDTTGAGTSLNPYLTFTKCLTVAVAGDTIHGNAGTYYEYLAPATSGTAGNPIRIEGAYAGTTLDGALTSSATTISVASTAAFLSSGGIWIEYEYVTYTGKTATTFTTCTRGAGGTGAYAHATAFQVDQWQTIIEGSVSLSNSGWTDTGGGVYSKTFSGTPAIVSEGGRAIRKVAKLFMDGTTQDSSGYPAFLNGLDTLALASNAIKEPHGHTGSGTLFWEGMEALWGYKNDGKIYIRWRDGSNVNTHTIRSCKTGEYTFKIWYKSYITLADLKIVGGENPVYLFGDTSTAADTAIIIDRCYLSGGRGGNELGRNGGRLVVEGNVNSSYVDRSLLSEDYYGTDTYGQGIWEWDTPGHTFAYNFAQSAKLYYFDKKCTSDTGGDNSDGVSITNGGTGLTSGADDFELKNSRVIRTGRGVGFGGGGSGGDVNTLIHDNKIWFNYTQGIYIAWSGQMCSNLKIYNNKIGWGGQYCFRIDLQQPSNRTVYVYRNKFLPSTQDNGHGLSWTGGGIANGGAFWFYHNSISGGNESMELGADTFNGLHILNNVLSSCRWSGTTATITEMRNNFIPSGPIWGAGGTQDGNPSGCAGNYSGYGTNTKTGNRFWANLAEPDWNPAGNALDNAYDLSVQYPTLPGIGSKIGTAYDIGAVEYDPTPPDLTNPIVTIMAPTSQATYETTESSLTVSGTASDDVALSAITYAGAGSGTATGTTSWSFSASLSLGANVIVVTATDTSANTSTDTITITRLTPTVPGVSLRNKHKRDFVGSW